MIIWVLSSYVITLLFNITWSFGCYHPMLSRYFLILHNHPMFSSLVIIPFFHLLLLSHITVSSYITIPCYHPILILSLVIITYYHWKLSCHVIIPSYHTMFSYNVVTPCYHNMLWYHVIPNYIIPWYVISSEVITASIFVIPENLNYSFFMTLNYIFVNYLLKFLNLLTYLKGQCHEMVVDVRPWCGSLALN
jgi:hypothetical protein